MSIDLIDNYNKAVKAIYDHVNFAESWEVLPIDDNTHYYWRLNDTEDIVYFSENKDNLIINEEEDIEPEYSTQIITHTS